MMANDDHECVFQGDVVVGSWRVSSRRLEKASYEYQ